MPHAPLLTASFLGALKKATCSLFLFNYFAISHERETEDNKNMKNTKVPESFNTISAVVPRP